MNNPQFTTELVHLKTHIYPNNIAYRNCTDSNFQVPNMNNLTFQIPKLNHTLSHHSEAGKRAGRLVLHINLSFSCTAYVSHDNRLSHQNDLK